MSIPGVSTDIETVITPDTDTTIVGVLVGDAVTGKVREALPGELAVPITVAAGETFTVRANTQVGYLNPPILEQGAQQVIEQGAIFYPAGQQSGPGGDALTTDPLSQFAATTSAQLAGVISDETGSGALVFATSPTLVTPILGTPTSGNLANCTGYAYGSLTGVPSTFTPASHTHGNITNEGTIGSTADLLLGTGTAGAIETKTASDVRTLLGLAMTDSPTFAGGTFNGIVVQQTTTNSTTAWQVRNKDGLPIASVDTFNRIFIAAADGFACRVNDGGTYLYSNGFIGWTSGLIASSGAADLVVRRGGPGILEQRNGTAGQVARWAKTWTSGTNNELIELDCAGNATTFDIAVCSGSAGGTNRELRIGQKYAGGAFSSWLSFGTDGAATFSGNTTFNANATFGGALTRITSAGGLQFPSTGYGIFWLSSTTFRNRSDGTLTISNFAENDFDRLQLGGATSSFPAIKRSGTTTQFRLADDTADAPISCSNITASGSQITLSGLPTTNPGVAGRLWNDGGTLRIS